MKKNCYKDRFIEERLILLKVEVMYHQQKQVKKFYFDIDHNFLQYSLVM